MRGEDWRIIPSVRDLDGSPPHARGRRAAVTCMTTIRWITPACAGKTISFTSFSMTIMDHPRMRGEDMRPRLFRIRVEGSPPHARGRPVEYEHGDDGQGITPACAGKTWVAWFWLGCWGDHPRMRGEDFFS